MKLKRSEFLNTVKTKLIFHWSVLILLLPMIYWYGAIGVWYFVVLFASVLFHEYFHIWEARSQGIYVQDIKLFALGGAARMDGSRLMLDRKAGLWISLAGPLGSLILTILGFLLSFISMEIFFVIFVFNAMLLVFNLLPLFPMDGGRAFYAIMCKFKSPIKAHNIAVNVSFIGCGILALVSLAFQEWWFAIIFLFLIEFAGREKEMFNCVVSGQQYIPSGSFFVKTIKKYYWKIKRYFSK